MESIAIIGIGCRFPKVKAPESYWQLLRNGVNAITEVPKERWDINKFYTPQPATPGKMSTRWGGFLKQVDLFEPSFFGISPREAERMDPQQRLVLEVVWESLENAGIVPSSLSGSQTGVFIGIGNYDYGRFLVKNLGCVNAYDSTGNTLSIAANRLSYILNLRGPSLAIETACSSSLVALHFACKSLQSGESNLCLVGGVSLMLSPEPTIAYSHARMMAADGRCKTFDANADGFVRGEGCGIVILKRLADALNDGDNIQAIIRGSAVNQDGLTNGLTAPNGLSQQTVIRQALENAGVSPEQISYVETHGTGTPLGDPIEVNALKNVLMKERSPKRPCWIGSVKTNIGHLEAASGVASLIKVVLSLQHREIPPHLHLNQLNPYISLEGTSFSIPTKLQPWSCSDTRLAGVSSFGFGGTNCHVILEEAPLAKKVTHKTERPHHVLTLSAKSEQALRELVKNYADFIASHPEASLEDICFSANTGREHFNRRLACVTCSTTQLREQLKAFSKGKEVTGMIGGQKNVNIPPKIAFLFTGQGSQFVDMGRQLYETQPTFKQILDHCNKILRPYLKQPLLSVLYPESDICSSIDETTYTQPALFAIEYALFQLWKSWGVEPAVVMGHSVGEYVAACVAGVFSLEDGLKLIAERGRLMQELPKNGSMAAVFANEEQVAAAIQSYKTEVAIAAINGLQNVVVSGCSQAVEKVIATLQADGIKTKKLKVSHAFHSPLMEPMIEQFRQIATTVTYSTPNLKLISNVTGEMATATIATPEYWCEHIRRAVHFAKGFETINQLGYSLCVEIGPKPILLGMGRYCLPKEKVSDFVGLPSLYPGRDDWQQLLESLGALYVRRIPINWSSFDQDYARNFLPQLPTYPFQRQRYWNNFTEDNQANTVYTSQISSQKSISDLFVQKNIQQLTQQLQQKAKLSQDELKLLPKLLTLLAEEHQQQQSIVSSKKSFKDWLYKIEWQLKPRLTASQTNDRLIETGDWLIFVDCNGVGQSLGEQLRIRGYNTLLVYSGETYRNHDDGTSWQINPSNSADFERLAQELVVGDRSLRGIIHLWSLEASTSDELTVSALEQAQEIGVQSVQYWLKALNKFRDLGSPRLWLITKGVVSVGELPTTVAQSPLWGLGKVVALEHPEWWGGAIDLDPTPSQDNITMLLAELEATQGEDQLVFRQGKRYVARLVRQKLPEAKPISFSSDSTYLITGGLGKLGLRITQWMVAVGVKHLVLTSRREADKVTQITLNQLEQTGAKIVAIKADVSEKADMLRVFKTIQKSMPSLRGIIHAAGISSYETLIDMQPEIFKSVLRPKITGSWILHQLTRQLELDFFVGFSSISSVWGSKGQGHYAAANYFLDALAHYRQQLGLPALSINWGPWAGGGMASAEYQTWLTRIGVKGLKPESAIEALGYLLGTDCIQTTVADMDWTIFKSLYEARGKRLLLEQIEQQSQESAVSVSTQQSKILQSLAVADAREHSQLLTAFLQGEIVKVLRLNQPPNVQQDLFDLGMDSLMAIELASAISKSLQVELPIAKFMQGSNIASLTSILLKQLTTTSKPETIVEHLNLNREAVLDKTIQPNKNRLELQNIRSILLTGATGFLGAFLLHELLRKTDADIYCLVRGKDVKSGFQRIQNNLQSYSLWKTQDSQRIIPVLGDLSQSLLGLSSKQFEQLACQIDVIYHNAAVLNFVYPYSALKSTNVLGTQEVLMLACQAKVKPLHYVSTDAVFDSSRYYGKEVTEAEPIFHTEGIDLGYTQSKWVAEKLVTIARARGLPVVIYRPPLIAGDSLRGIWNTDDFTCRFLKGCIQMGSIPDMNCGITLVPVDYVSRAIVYLSQQQESLGRAFHLNNPNYTAWSELTSWINDFGYIVRQITYEEWETQLINTSTENVLKPLLPFFLRRWSDQKLTFAGLGQQRVKLNCQETVNILAADSITCPRFDSELLNTYFSYFIDSDFLNNPQKQPQLTSNY